MIILVSNFKNSSGCTGDFSFEFFSSNPIRLIKQVSQQILGKRMVSSHWLILERIEKQVVYDTLACRLTF